MSSCLTFKDVGLRLGRRDIFKGVSFDLDSESCLVLIGPSGEGKSLLLKVAAGLVSPSSGEVVRHGQISMAFQRNGLFDSMTPLENVLFPLRELKTPNAPEIALELLKSVGLQNHSHKKVSELSGGQQKRLGIARALAVRPQVVIYDDPTAGLDPVTSFEIIELIRQKRTQMGHATLMVTSDLRVAFELATGIGFLCRGSVMQWGSVETIRHSENPYVHQFVGGLETGPLSVL